MRYFQNLLLLAGGTALGACSFVLALFCYATATGLGRHGPSDLGAAGVAFLLVTGSATLGAIAGLLAAVWWIRHHDGLWTLRIWIGVTLGLVTGFALHFANKLPRVPTAVEYFESAPRAAVLTAALTTFAGLVARLTGSPQGPSGPPRT